jgi:hypothetical protein
MARIDGDDMPRAETIREPSDFPHLRGSAGDRCTSPCPGVYETSPPSIIAIALSQSGGEYFGDELKRQEEGISGHRSRGRQREQTIIENV